MVIGIYNALTIHDQEQVWMELLNFLHKIGDLHVLLIDDFNQVRKPTDKRPVSANVNGMDLFNKFINNAYLIEIGLQGNLFTWRNSISNSRIDRAFISNAWLVQYTFLHLLSLTRGPSDHNPLWLSNMNSRMGPKPFHFLDYWWDYPGFNKVIENF